MPSSENSDVRESASILELAGFLAGNVVCLECLLFVLARELGLQAVHLCIETVAQFDERMDCMFEAYHCFHSVEVENIILWSKVFGFQSHPRLFRTYGITVEYDGSHLRSTCKIKEELKQCKYSRQR